MPIYEYACQSCGARSEVLQKLSDPPLETCSECGGSLRKLVSAPAFHLKGSGWYATDYGGKAGGAKVDAGKGDGKAETKAETKDASGTTSSSETAKSDKPAPSGGSAPAT
jgi:putative FmdB family regulatory protein